MSLSIAPVRGTTNPAPAGGASNSHTVQRGETLSGIAKRYGVSVDALMQSNPDIVNPDIIYPDQKINVPKGGGARTGGAQQTAKNGRAGAGVSAGQLQQIVPGLSASKAAEVAPHLSSAMAEANINTPQRQAMFIAQLAHESGGFRYSEEIWGPTAAQRGYEGRSDLGNTQPGDGYRYRGRGYIQLTGRHNYTAAGKALGLDLAGNPDLAAKPENAARVAAWYWNSRNINEAADAGNFVEVTRRINGGTNGLSDRQAYYDRARTALGSDASAPKPDNKPGGGSEPATSGRYTVKSGDTLSGIAQRHGVSLSQLVAANPQIKNPNLIYPGQNVNIPGRGNPAASVYTVKSGDTLSGIAQQQGVSLSQLVSANPQIKNPNLIYPGQQINIPGAQNAAGPSATSKSATTGGPSGASGAQGSGAQTVNIAERFLDRNVSDLKRSGELPMNPSVPNNINCANFVSAVLEKNGLLSSGEHTNAVETLRKTLLGKGWQAVSLKNAKPGDVVIMQNNGASHTEIVASNKNGKVTFIGANNRNADGSQRITYDDSNWAYNATSLVLRQP